LVVGVHNSCSARGGARTSCFTLEAWAASEPQFWETPLRGGGTASNDVASRRSGHGSPLQQNGGAFRPPRTPSGGVCTRAQSHVNAGRVPRHQLGGRPPVAEGGERHPRPVGCSWSSHVQPVVMVGGGGGKWRVIVITRVWQTCFTYQVYGQPLLPCRRFQSKQRRSGLCVQKTSRGAAARRVCGDGTTRRCR